MSGAELRTAAGSLVHRSTLLVGLALTTTWSSGCAGITSERVVTLRPRPGVSRTPASIPPRDRDADDRKIISRAVAAAWEQRGATLTIELQERRACQRVESVPVLREERVVRRADAALYVEYALAAAAYAIAAFAFAQPGALSNTVIQDDAGNPVEDPTPGYVTGGIFVALGSGALGAAIYDTLRARDEVVTIATHELREGPREPCNPASSPAAGRRVTLSIGPYRDQVRTSSDGVAHFVLPAALDLLEAEVDADADADADADTSDAELDTASAPREPAPSETAAREPASDASLAATLTIEGSAEPPLTLPFRVALPYKRTLNAPARGRLNAPASSPSPPPTPANAPEPVPRSEPP